MMAVNIEKIGRLIRRREELCEIQAKSVDSHYRLCLAFEGNYGFVGNYRILPELEGKLKETIRTFYEAEINRVTEEINKLCQEQ